MKNYSIEKEVSAIFLGAQKKLLDSDFHMLDIGTAVESVGLSRHAYYSTIDSESMPTKSTLTKLAVAFQLSSTEYIRLCNLKGYIMPHTVADEIVISLFQQGIHDELYIDEQLIAASERPIFSVRTR